MNVSTGGRLRGRATVAALVCAIALIPGPSYAAPNDPGPRNDSSIERIRTELDGLYRQAEVATEAYDAANDKATKQTKRLASLQTELARAEGRVDDLHDLLGAAARTQYRGGFLASTGVQLLLGDHADQALNEASQTRQAMQGIANASEAQKSARAELGRRTDAAAKELRDLKRTRADKAGAKKEIEKKIAEAERIESGLEEKDTRKLAQLEKQRADASKSKWPGSGSGGGSGDGTKVSGAAGKAVGFAMAQIGKPYVWGAVGPSSYDCSGLTSAAWAAAGHPIPRTSQAQWQGLTRVSLASARPGDLIIYYDATHVGMYIGGGQVVHAPRPGRTITTAPAASMPILGVVRPGV
ncbi:NlpC/P60 family protein [Streptomyces sp. NPDC090052]|uniref:C40 family peptidase n=1 Tax=unclassified Streptomyces TaxID=2593676 RepID=UPI0022535196|nr:C40 family peptidase [Streptomyces sp. NBC_01306]MCX4725687.1 NlpC/P60 family protein [Streptomyces sp. NBC_01306]WSV04959.1 NlpC/P60 family protein [Streptomyces sp. NBC_01020]